tara:strand:+ start:1826 stop:3217 length:1392 start_codon:yes stop_codon:yes gene_type:complete
MFKKIPIWLLLFILILFIIFIPIYGFILTSSFKTGLMYNTLLGNTSEAIANFPRNVNRSFRALSTSVDKVDNEQKIEGGFNLKENIKLNNTLALVEKIDKKTDLKFVELIDPISKKILHDWKIPSEQLRKILKMDELSNLRSLKGINLPKLNLNDGSIVFMFSNEESQILIKMDRNSNIEWILHDNESDEFSTFHNNYGLDYDGNIYSPVFMNKKNQLSDYIKSKASRHVEHSYEDQGYVKVSKNGKILDVVSITEILMRNNLGIYIYGVGPLEWDALHINDIEPALFDGAGWKKNDLLISSRHLSLIFIYRPSTDKIVWHKFGPWINQHDPDFIDYKTITVFGNDLISHHFNRVDTQDYMLTNKNKKNNIWKYDFYEDRATKIFEDAINKSRFKTYTGGSHYFDGKNFLSNYYDNMGVTEFYYANKIVGQFSQIASDGKVYLTSDVQFIKYENFPKWLKFSE